jgi:hypothetical protein
MASSGQTNHRQDLTTEVARLTPTGWFWVLVYLGVPVMLLGLVLDLVVQTALGWCVGIWCVFNP